MSTVDDALRSLVAEVVREELRHAFAESGIALAGAPTPPSTRYLTAAEAGAIAGVTAGTVRDWVTHRRLPCFWAGRRVRIKEADLHAFMAGPEKSPAEVDPEAWAEKILAEQATRCAACGHLARRHPGNGACRTAKCACRRYQPPLPR